MSSKIAVVFDKYPVLSCVGGKVAPADLVIHLAMMKENLMQAVEDYKRSPTPYHFDSVPIWGRAVVEAVDQILKLVQPHHVNPRIAKLRAAVDNYRSKDETGHLLWLMGNKVVHGPGIAARDQTPDASLEAMRRWCVLRNKPEEGRKWVEACGKLVVYFYSDDVADCFNEIAFE